MGDHLRADHPRVHPHHGVGPETKVRLRALGHNVRPPSEEVARLVAADRAARWKRRLAVALVVAVLVAAAVEGTVRWFRPLPTPALRGLATRIPVPGTAPHLPWPAAGEAALGVPGLGTLGAHGGTRPVPIGVLSGVLTAYVVLKDHPLATGRAPGPTMAVTTPTLAAYRTGTAAGEPEVPVSSGESLTELDALEGLLVGSGTDMATLLANWDAGSTSAFVAKMQLAARTLGLRHTRITQPGGPNDAVVSTPGDLVRLAEAAMGIPLFRQLVSLGQATLPQAGLQYNPNYLLGQHGVVGVAAGSETTGNGCYLFAAQKRVGGRRVTLYGAVLGQSGPIGPTSAAVEAGDALMKAALPALATVPVLPAGRVVGRLAAPWGASVPVTVSEGVALPAWPGSTVPVTHRLARRAAPVPAGTRVGWLQVRQGGRRIEVPLRSRAPLPGPSGLWRLTH